MIRLKKVKTLINKIKITKKLDTNLIGANSAKMPKSNSYIDQLLEGFAAEVQLSLLSRQLLKSLGKLCKDLFHIAL
jgi:hypothetical protein